MCVQTFGKTVLYFLVEICGGFQYTQPGDTANFMWFLVPNAFWLVVPFACVWSLAAQLARTLRHAETAGKRDLDTVASSSRAKRASSKA